MRGTAHIGMLVLIGILLVVSNSNGEPTEALTAESVTLHLTGGGQGAWRSWVKTQWIVRLGAPRCEQGESWLFGHDGQGIKKSCENGVTREQKFTWAWVGIQNAEPILKVDGKPYVVDFRQQEAQVKGDPPILTTILHTLRTDQGQPIEEIWLELEDR